MRRSQRFFFFSFVLSPSLFRLSRTKGCEGARRDSSGSFRHVRDHWIEFERSTGRTILCRVHTRDRGDSYLRLINYCPYSLEPGPPPPSSSIEERRASLTVLRSEKEKEKGREKEIAARTALPLVPLRPWRAPGRTRAHLNINLPLHCPLLLLTYLTDFYFYCFLRTYESCRPSRDLYYLRYPRPTFFGTSVASRTKRG